MLADAEAFFDDRLFDLGLLSELPEDISVKLNVNLTFDNVGDGFDLGFIFGNASPRMSEAGFTFSSVPEPSGMIIGFWILGVSMMRRRVS